MPLYTHQDNKQDRLIMIHVPKTAGTSQIKALRRNKYREDRLLPKYSLQNFRRKLQGIRFPASVHGTAKQHKEVIGERAWEDTFSFAFVRNPWDLMVSNYFWWLQIASNSKHDRLSKQAEEISCLGGFEEFLNSVYGSEMIVDHYGSMADWIVDDNDQIIVKFVGKFENLENDWHHIGKIINLRDTKLFHHNNSKHHSYQDYYNPQTKKLIENRFEWIIEQFEYKF
jgi:hypothetical protein